MSVDLLEANVLCNLGHTNVDLCLRTSDHGFTIGGKTTTSTRASFISHSLYETMRESSSSVSPLYALGENVPVYRDIMGKEISLIGEVDVEFFHGGNIFSISFFVIPVLVTGVLFGREVICSLGLNIMFASPERIPYNLRDNFKNEFPTALLTIRESPRHVIPTVY